MSDKEYRREFVILSLSTLTVSFITVFITIVYQVFMANESFGDISLGIINALWVGATSGFILLNILFILVSFMIFFTNDG